MSICRVVGSYNDDEIFGPCAPRLKSNSEEQKDEDEERRKEKRKKRKKKITTSEPCHVRATYDFSNVQSALFNLSRLSQF